MINNGPHTVPLSITLGAPVRIYRFWQCEFYNLGAVLCRKRRFCIIKSPHHIIDFFYDSIQLWLHLCFSFYLLCNPGAAVQIRTLYSWRSALGTVQYYHNAKSLLQDYAHLDVRMDLLRGLCPSMMVILVCASTWSFTKQNATNALLGMCPAF